MSRFVTPAVFQVGYTTMDMRGLKDYLKHTRQEAFLKTLTEAELDNVEAGEVLVSTFAKLCYKSLVVGENANISQVRDIKGNIAGIQRAAHGSVFEHVAINFIVTDCSRVFTHELVRHRVGTAFSQTSGRYCRIEPGKLELVFDPILEGCEDLLESCMGKIERTIYFAECRKGLRKPPFGMTADQIPADVTFNSIGEICDRLGWGENTPDLGDEKVEAAYQRCWNRDSKPTPADIAMVKNAVMWVPTGKEEGVNFDYKKKLTSAIRRIAPNGQSNEIAVTLNVRTLRHTIMMRTSRHSEWEIRYVFGEIYRLCREKWPLLFADARERKVDGLLEVYGMKMAPYERNLDDYGAGELLEELHRRINNGEFGVATLTAQMLAAAECAGTIAEQRPSSQTPAERSAEDSDKANAAYLQSLGLMDNILQDLKEAGAVRVMLPSRVGLEVGDKLPCKFPDTEKQAVVMKVNKINHEMIEVEMRLEEATTEDDN